MMGNTTMRRKIKVIGYIILITVIISLIILVLNWFVYPFLGEQFNGKIYLITTVIVGVFGFFAAFNEFFDFVNRFIDGEEQISKPNLDREHKTVSTQSSKQIQNIIAERDITGANFYFGEKIVVNNSDAKSQIDEASLSLSKEELSDTLKFLDVRGYKGIDVENLEIVLASKYKPDRVPQIFEDLLKNHLILLVDSGKVKITELGKKYISS